MEISWKMALSTTTEKGLDNFAVVCLEISNRIDVFALSRLTQKS
jgi:hypothetical protein